MRRIACRPASTTIPAYGESRIAGTLTQTRFDAGIDADGSDVDVSAGIGWFGVGFTGGSDGTSAPASAHLATPSILVQLFPDSKWSANLGASGSFTLPNLWQQYAPDDGYDGLVYDRNALYDATLTYTDDARFRVSVEGASQRVAGFTNGMVTSTGVSVAWQVAPAISLRAWTMHVDDTTAASRRTFRFIHPGSPATVNAFWLTYDNGAHCASTPSIAAMFSTVRRSNTSTATCQGRLAGGCDGTPALKTASAPPIST